MSSKSTFVSFDWNIAEFSIKITPSLFGFWIYNYNVNSIKFLTIFLNFRKLFYLFFCLLFVSKSHGCFSLMIKAQLITNCVSNTCQKTAPTAMCVQAQRKAS